ncbi:hypothetical protein [Streptomyces lydicus]|uniref:hypothetical protein n=1 Tax=Streptomyces lydicus TaxID=47763 RepID=UPI00131CA9AF|nr:hypothetical protein [Streptomyces lydicus]
MTPAPVQRRTCQNCNTVFTLPARPGRPSTTCSEHCKLALRRKNPARPDLSMPEGDMDEAVEDLHRIVSDLLAAAQGRAPSA